MIIEMQPVTRNQSLANKVTSSHVWKQVLVTITTCLLCLCGGCTYGYSAVLVPFLKGDEKFQYSDHYDSWIAAIAPLSMAFGCLFSGMMIDKFGRKYTHILLLWPFLIGYLVLAFARTIPYLFLGRFITGMCAGVFRSIGAVYLVEVTDPKNRTFFQFTLSLSSTIGILSGHVIGGHFTKRYSCLIFSSPIFAAFVLIIFLKESPLWLISKGKIDEGIESFEWYRCKSEAAQKELTDVLEKHKNKSEESRFRNTLRIMCTKKFFKAYCTGLVLFTIMQFCGVNNFIFYSQELLKPTFSGEINVFLLMMVVDSLRISANILLFPIMKYCPRRKTFFTITCIVILLLTGIIVFLSVNPTGLIWLLLVCFIIFILLGGITISVAWTFVAEIFPDEIRGIGSGLSASTSFLLLFVSVMITPHVMQNFGIIAVYSTYAIITAVSFIPLLFLLPDTDGKSLHEIEKNL